MYMSWIYTDCVYTCGRQTKTLAEMIVMRMHATFMHLNLWHLPPLLYVLHICHFDMKDVLK